MKLFIKNETSNYARETKTTNETFSCARVNQERKKMKRNNNITITILTTVCVCVRVVYTLYRLWFVGSLARPPFIQQLIQLKLFNEFIFFYHNFYLFITLHSLDVRQNPDVNVTSQQKCAWCALTRSLNHDHYILCAILQRSSLFLLPSSSAACLCIYIAATQRVCVCITFNVANKNKLFGLAFLSAQRHCCFFSDLDTEF